MGGTEGEGRLERKENHTQHHRKDGREEVVFSGDEHYRHQYAAAHGEQVQGGNLKYRSAGDFCRGKGIPGVKDSQKRRREKHQDGGNYSKRRIRRKSSSVV